MDDIRQRCLEVFAEALEVDPGVINDDTSPENLEEWDSLAHVQLILKLQEAFSISIPPDEGIDIERFKMVYNCVAEKVGGI